MHATLVAELHDEGLRLVTANDAGRHSFTVTAGARLLAVAGDDLSVLHAWPLDAPRGASHASLAGERLALVSGADQVVLLDADGSPRWSFPHAPWTGDFESGCAWFDAAGRPLAVVPSPAYDGSLIVQLDLATGRPVAQAAIAAYPAGIHPVHHANGWVGLSVGEGQDAARAWWVRAAQAGLEVLFGCWDDVVLADADQSGDRVLTTPHVTGPLTVRSFPDLAVVRTVSPPREGESWDYTACFAGDHLVAGLRERSERTVAIDPGGQVHDLDTGQGWLVPAADSWLTVERTRLRRWTLR